MPLEQARQGTGELGLDPPALQPFRARDGRGCQLNSRGSTSGKTSQETASGRLTGTGGRRWGRTSISDRRALGNGTGASLAVTGCRHLELIGHWLMPASSDFAGTIRRACGCSAGLASGAAGLAPLLPSLAAERLTWSAAQGIVPEIARLAAWGKRWADQTDAQA